VSIENTWHHTVMEYIILNEIKVLSPTRFRRCSAETNFWLTHLFNGPFFRDYPGEPVPERQNQSEF